MPEEKSTSEGAIAFALIYFTFFLDNVLLTVLVPIIPDWVRGESLALWAERAEPLAALLNNTIQHITPHSEGVGGSQAVVGLVLGAKATAQLVTAPVAAVAVSRRGPAVVLRAATLLLALAATVLWSCGGRRGWGAAVGVCAARAAHGAGAALAGVAGLALAAAAVPRAHTDRAVGALLGAVALGVLVGYPFGGVSYEVWSRSVPFLMIAAALVFDLGMQLMFLNKEEYNKRVARVPEPDGWLPDGRLPDGSLPGGWLPDESLLGGAGPARACAGAVLLTTSVMAALEPCLPLWIIDNFHTQRWQTGLVFLPDSVGYLLAASALGGVSRALGAERLALAGQLAVGGAALAVPHARSVAGLVLPQLALGLGLGAADAALVPALLARHGPRRLPALAALIQAASSAAYAIGPIVGGLVSWCVGFESTMRALGVANLLYAAYLYRQLSIYPLSEQWGAPTPEDEDTSCAAEHTPLQYHQLR